VYLLRNPISLASSENFLVRTLNTPYNKDRRPPIGGNLEFRLNDRPIYKLTYGGNDPSVLIPLLLSAAPNLEYWSEDALREFLQGSLEMILEFCSHTLEAITADLKAQPKYWQHRETAKTLKRKTANFMKKLSSHLRIIPHLKKEQLLKHAYDLLLSCDRLGPLRDFGMCNKFGDKVYGDPEKHTISKKE